jgi:hypothetical protein
MPCPPMAGCLTSAPGGHLLASPRSVAVSAYSRGMLLEPTGRAVEVVVVAPTHCVNGHELRPPNVGVFTPGAAGEILWRCRTCNAVTQQDGTEWIDPKAGHGSLYG